MGGRRFDERGGVSTWILVMLPVVALFVGVTWDAGNLLALKREADNVAASSARAGAQLVDQATIYEHQNGIGDGRVGLDQDGARERAELIGGAQGGEDIVVTFRTVNGSSVGAGNRAEVINVNLQRKYAPTFLSLFGFGEISVEGEATVRVRSAIERDVFDNTLYLDQQNG